MPEPRQYGLLREIERDVTCRQSSYSNGPNFFRYSFEFQFTMMIERSIR